MKGKVYYKDILAGIIEETDTGFRFTYDPEYVKAKGEPVSLTLPLTELPFTSDLMFPFFDGLIPEGWLLDVATETWKIDSRNRMKLLLTVCQDCIGAVKVIADES
ncbi:MAG: HipA N-terminal domain-containing protein [Candidatus Scalindua sp.]